MSTDSSPPPPSSLDAVKKTTETITVFAEWSIQLIQGRNWLTLLLLIKADLLEKKATKGLRAFTCEDAEIFAKLQRDKDLQ